MERYLTNTYGGADITWNNSNSLSSNIGGSRRGIVMYRHPSGGAAMNHVTAWQSGANVAIDGWYQESPSGTTSSFWGF